jgi:hypothetical protein
VIQRVCRRVTRILTRDNDASPSVDASDIDDHVHVRRDGFTIDDCGIRTSDGQICFGIRHRPNVDAFDVDRTACVGRDRRGIHNDFDIGGEGSSVNNYSSGVMTSTVQLTFVVGAALDEERK